MAEHDSGVKEIDPEIKFKINKSKMFYLQRLKSAMIKLHKYSGEVLKKIETEGLTVPYSGNSDILRHSEDAWRASLGLCELDEIVTRLENKTYRYPDPPEQEDLLKAPEQKDDPQQGEE